MNLKERYPDTVHNLLKRDPVRNANILGFMASYPISEIVVIGESALVKGTSDKSWVFVSSESSQELQELVKSLSPTDVNFAVIEDWMIPIIAANRKRLWTLTTLRLVLPPEIALMVHSVSTQRLGTKWAQYIYDNYSYKQYTDIDYITDRLARGPSAGVFEGDRLVAWALTHDDGAIGFLQALEEYRGKGYALAVTNAVITQVRAMGNVPFVHIEETNVKSLALAKKTGFVVDRRVHWFELEY